MDVPHMQFRERAYDIKTGELLSEDVYIILDEIDAFEQYSYVIGDLMTWEPVFEFTYDPFGAYAVYIFVEEGVSVYTYGEKSNSLSFKFEE